MKMSRNKILISSFALVYLALVTPSYTQISARECVYLSGLSDSLSGSQDAANILGDLYLQAVLFPEEFDSCFELYRKYIGENVTLCAHDLVEKYTEVATEKLLECAVYTDFDLLLQLKCINQDPEAEFALRMAGILDVLRGDDKWVDTLPGRDNLEMKYFYQMQAPGFWVTKNTRSLKRHIDFFIACK